MILDPNGMPILQPTIDNAETATFNDAFAAIGNAVVAVENVRQIKTYKWADNAARTAQTGMTAGDEGYQTDTDTAYRYDGAVWGLAALVPQTGTMTPASGYTLNAANDVFVVGKVCTVSGYITKNSGVFASSSVVGTLGSGFRPTAGVGVACAFTNATTGWMQISADGTLKLFFLGDAATSVQFNATYRTP